MQTNKVKTLTCSIFYIFILNSALFAFASDFATLYRAGEKALARKNYQSAVASFKRAVLSNPSGIKVRFRLGQALYYSNNFSESYAQFQKILVKMPNNIPARIFLIKNLIELKKIKEAKMQLEWILKVQPELVQAQNLLAKIQINKQNNKPATLALNNAPEKVPLGFKPLPVNDVEEISAVKPYVAREELAKKISQQPQKSANMPEALRVKTWNIKKFLARASKSFGVSLEYAKYCIEKGDISSAEKYLKLSTQLSKGMKGIQKQILEAKILGCLVCIYNRDFEGFGKNLLKLKPILSTKSYQSFLDIYNRAREAKSNEDLTKLSAGVAMGAGHFQVAMKLFERAHYVFPDNQLIANMLVEAQIQCHEYDAAEKVMLEEARKDRSNFSIFFNLAKFYLTAKYNPELSYHYASYAKKINEKDMRISVLYALLEYSQGKIDTGIARLQKLLPTIKDRQFRDICLKLIKDGKMANSRTSNHSIDFAEVLALPGSAHSPRSSYRVLGEECLKRGSFFSAMRYFALANDMAEIGRTYLGLASMLSAMGEKKTASLSAGFGKKALLDELVNNPKSARANLYLALYSFERKDFVAAKKAIENGLKANAEKGTRQKLTALLREISS